MSRCSWWAGAGAGPGGAEAYRPPLSEPALDEAVVYVDPRMAPAGTDAVVLDLAALTQPAPAPDGVRVEPPAALLGPAASRGVPDGVSLVLSGSALVELSPPSELAYRPDVGLPLTAPHRVVVRVLAVGPADAAVEVTLACDLVDGSVAQAVASVSCWPSAGLEELAVELGEDPNLLLPTVEPVELSLVLRSRIHRIRVGAAPAAGAAVRWSLQVETQPVLATTRMLGSPDVAGFVWPRPGADGQVELTLEERACVDEATTWLENAYFPVQLAERTDAVVADRSLVTLVGLDWLGGDPQKVDLAAPTGGPVAYEPVSLAAGGQATAVPALGPLLWAGRSQFDALLSNGYPVASSVGDVSLALPAADGTVVMWVRGPLSFSNQSCVVSRRADGGVTHVEVRDAQLYIALGGSGSDHPVRLADALRGLGFEVEVEDEGRAVVVGAYTFASVAPDFTWSREAGVTTVHYADEVAAAREPPDTLRYAVERSLTTEVLDLGADHADRVWVVEVPWWRRHEPLEGRLARQLRLRGGPTFMADDALLRRVVEDSVLVSSRTGALEHVLDTTTGTVTLTGGGFDPADVYTLRYTELVPRVVPAFIDLPEGGRVTAALRVEARCADTSGAVGAAPWRRYTPGAVVPAARYWQIRVSLQAPRPEDAWVGLPGLAPVV
jgi:hypothetical protein